MSWVLFHYAYRFLKDVRPRLKGNKLKAFQHLTKKERRILVVGDLHEPFCLKGYLEFCQEIYAKWNCNQVIFIGDIIDNHNRIIMRKAFSSSIPREWIKDYNEVLGTKWNWVESIVYDDVLYEHGEGGQAKTKAKNNMMSSVCGHTHTQAYVEWLVGKKYRVFGMQVGCGVDASTYAAAYAKNFKKQAIGCGVVLGGHTAINVLMPLGKPKPKKGTVL